MMITEYAIQIGGRGYEWESAGWYTRNKEEAIYELAQYREHSSFNQNVEYRIASRTISEWEPIND